MSSALTFSVVVSTYNRLSFLKKCLASLEQLSLPPFEIIIVNDGSTDGTHEWLENFSLSSQERGRRRAELGRPQGRVRSIHHATNLGLSAVRNTGIKAAHGEIVAFIDDDCIADPEWLTHLVRGFSDERIGFVIGATYYRERGYRGYFPERLVRNEQAEWPKGCNIAYRKKVFEDIGYFDDRFFWYNNEDSEMAIRAVAHGWRYARVPEAIVYHQAVDWTVPALLRSARNASVWPVLKKQYPQHYREFDPPVLFGAIVNAWDYIYLLTLPFLLPFLLLRYIFHGKRDLKIFFTKWPLLLLLRRFYVWREVIRQGMFMM